MKSIMESVTYEYRLSKLNENAIAVIGKAIQEGTLYNLMEQVERSILESSDGDDKSYFKKIKEFIKAAFTKFMTFIKDFVRDHLGLYTKFIKENREYIIAGQKILKDEKLPKELKIRVKYGTSNVINGIENIIADNVDDDIDIENVRVPSIPISEEIIGRINTVMEELHSGKINGQYTKAEYMRDLDIGMMTDFIENYSRINTGISKIYNKWVNLDKIGFSTANREEAKNNDVRRVVHSNAKKVASLVITNFSKVNSYWRDIITDVYAVAKMAAKAGKEAAGNK